MLNKKTMDKNKYNRCSIRLKNYDYSSAGAYFITLCTHNRQYLFGEIVNGEMCLNEYGKIVRDEWFCSVHIRNEIELFENEFIVMPNHIHGVVWIVENVGATGGSPQRTTGGSSQTTTGCSPQPTNSGSPQPTTECSPQPTTGGSSQPTTGCSPQPTTGWSPQPTTGWSPQPMTGWSPQPTTGWSPQPTTEWSPQPTTGCSPQRPNGPLKKSLSSFVAGFKSTVTKQINQIRQTPGIPVWQRNYYEHIIRNDNELNKIREYIINNPLTWETDDNYV